MTRITTGASLIPDSISRVAVSRGGRPSARRVEKTAAASVEDTIAPSSRPVRQPVSSSRTATPAVTSTLTATPTVDSTTASGTAGRTALHRVVRPPSVRITTSAARPSVWDSAASSKRSPRPDSPIAIPIPR